jgi:hypothetical protein
MNVFTRLVLIGSTVVIGGQLIRWEPALIFPIGVLAAVWVGMWLSASIYDEQQAMETAGESASISEEFGPHMAALAVEEHHDRWEAQR